MKRDRHILAGLRSLVFIWLIGSTSPATQVNEPNDEAARLQRLRQWYEELDEAVTHLLAVNAEAIAENPDLEFVERGLYRVNEMERGRMPGRNEFYRYRASHPDPQKFEKIHRDCRTAFGREAWTEALRDPEREQELRPILILSYRHMLPQAPNWPEEFTEALKKERMTVFDPTDPNDERLWRNLKQHMFELSQREQDERARLIEEGVPEVVREYLGQYDVMNACKELYWYWMRVYVPKKLVEAARDFTSCEGHMHAIIGADLLKTRRRLGCELGDLLRLYQGHCLYEVLSDYLSDLKDGWFEERSRYFKSK
ncbi:MAG: hypothetical protein ACYTBJ_07945 [Planctomycetota bacterium]|jgi:hypothetical protein